MTFARTIDGLPVLGRGSKARITIDVHGSPVGFEIDWVPWSATADDVALVDTDTLTRRQYSAALRLAGSSVALTRTECGYYDPGALSTTSQQLQPACIYAYESVVTSDEMGHPAYEDVIPAARAVIRDPGWAETCSASE